ncbi:MAG: TatD family hydrolase [Bacteroidales bacterium]|nr:TatD family hydrolase [Bacteroidales bacterium]
MQFIDTHSHLYLPEFDNDRNEVINRAIREGIEKICLPNIDTRSIKPMMDVVNKYPDFCFPMIGLHPTSVKKNYMDELNKVKENLLKENFIAIGEIGIDLFWDKTYKKEQMKAFREQIGLAIDNHLPVVIHIRESFDEVFQILEEFKPGYPKGIFHSFSGNLDQAHRAITMGFKLGIGGIVTFKNSGLDKVVKEIDPKHIVLETDSPYLAPVPKRGKRNESSYLVYTAQKISELHNVTVKKIAEITTQNAIKIFKLNK